MHSTYIGSTPCPPRRLRQHNGELTQGAFRTSRHRPWVMQMIVYGFPSKLAALQFEWAWQHPYSSRHLRDDSGKPIVAHDRKGRYLKGSIETLQMMLSNPPYNLWPLHIKIFTKDAEKLWKQGGFTSKLPEGLTCVTELEGVDGKSGLPGSGRTGPIDVTDSTFTSKILEKQAQLSSADSSPSCAVCGGAVTDFVKNPLSSGICPHTGCPSVSHLLCLSSKFLAQSPLSKSLVPRGGKCPSCQKYTLWGDIVKGSYRRHTGTAISAEEEEAEEAEGSGQVFSSEDESDEQMRTSPTKTSRRTQKPAQPQPLAGTSRLPATSARKRGRPPGAKNKPKAGAASSSGEEFDFAEADAMPSTDSDNDGPAHDVAYSAAAKRSKTTKRTTTTEPAGSMAPASVIPRIAVPANRGKTSVPKRTMTSSSRQFIRQKPDSGEAFDFAEADAVPSTDSEDDSRFPLVPRQKPKSTSALKPTRVPVILQTKPKSTAYVRAPIPSEQDVIEVDSTDDELEAGMASVLAR